MAYVEPQCSAAPVICEGTCEGTILRAPRGDGGFGYDPVFLSDDLKMAFAEASEDAKNRVSHRGRALQKLASTLRERFGARAS